MKTIFKIIILFLVFFVWDDVSAQAVRSLNITKQQPGRNGILKATTNANANAKIHAHSNSVFGTGNTQPDYTKKKQPQKEEIKDDGEMKKKNKIKKEKK